MSHFRYKLKIKFEITDSEHTLRRTRPFGVSEEVDFLPTIPISMCKSMHKCDKIYKIVLVEEN